MVHSLIDMFLIESSISKDFLNGEAHALKTILPPTVSLFVITSRAYNKALPPPGTSEEVAEVKLAFLKRISRSRSYVSNDEDNDEVGVVRSEDALVPVRVAVFLALRAVDGRLED